MNGPSREEIQRQIDKLGPWFHNMSLGGVQTAPDHFLGDYPTIKWRTFEHAIPEDLSGKSVLDIGCNAGFYSIEMKKRGADRVVAIDFDEDYLAQARFAAKVSGVKIEFRKLSVYQLKELGEQFDLVLFMGVLYHLRHPLLALDLVHDYAARDMMVFQCLQRGSKQVATLEEDYPFEEQEIFNQPGYPLAYFVEHRYSHDPTNWWLPNRACVEAMLRSSGFEILDQPEAEVYVCRRLPQRDSDGACF
ncbi:MAG TPA: TIGR04290 family methyltransferase [Bryobacteraceae bacterium]|jgi:tRNA (mo5U34)-methyltransferase|nr:TIGR04290 family methyltransferase [Bryobacteraceae bacterium]